MREKKRARYFSSLTRTMRKLKTLIPTLKERKRFIAYELKSRKKLQKDVSSNVVNQVRSFLGVFDSAKAGILSIEYDRTSQRGILRTSNNKTDETRTALMLLTGISKTQVMPRVLGISGTLKNARKKYMSEG